MDTSILENLGLTNAEIKTYLALLELGTSKAGMIIKKTGLQNSVVHLTLAKLAEKGFISFIKKGGVKEYSATNPENILKFIDDKKRKFENLLPELLLKQKPKLNQEAEIYRGFNGLKNMLLEFIKDGKMGEEYLFFLFDTKNPEKYENVCDFLRSEYYIERKKKGLVVKGLAPIELKPVVWKAEWTKKCVKFVNFPIPTSLFIFQDKIAFVPWEDEEISFLIKSRQLAESFKLYFYSIWNKTRGAK